MTTFVYVANADSHDISVLGLDARNGELAEIGRHVVGGVVMPLAVSPDRRVLYASIRSEPFSVLSLAIDPASGRLAEIGRAPLPASMCWISTDRSGRFLLAASYGGASSRSARSAPTASRARRSRSSPPTRTRIRSRSIRRTATPSPPASAAASCARCASTPPAGASPTTTRRRGRRAPEAGPRHFAFHPSAPFVYLLNELDARHRRARVRRAAAAAARVQTVSALPPGFAGGAPWAADIHLTPDGRFLYASERRSSTIAAFAVDPASGQLAPLGSVPTESQPRGFAIAPDGRFLFAVGQASHRLSRYAIDAATGALAKLGDQPVGKNPNWVEIVELAEAEGRPSPVSPRLDENGIPHREEGGLALTGVPLNSYRQCRYDRPAHRGRPSNLNPSRSSSPLHQ